tara:strand:- start:16565 stop:17404 length:840 start_codon:yes stop_codon:yes gene_type:complete
MPRQKYYLPLIHRSLISVYPFFRIGGFGLGNTLFPFFRAFSSCLRDGATLLYPHQNQIQPRNFLRDLSINSLRNYSNVYSHFNWATLPALESALIFYSRYWHNESMISSENNIIFSGYKNHFYDIIDFKSQIQKFIYFSFPEIKKSRMNVVAFHLRLGDFILNKKNISSEKILESLEYFTRTKSLTVKIYSDANYNQIISFLNIDRLPENVFLSSSISPMVDIIEMSLASYICGNPESTFVEWSRFLSSEIFNQNSYALISKSDYYSCRCSPIGWDVFL